MKEIQKQQKEASLRGSSSASNQEKIDDEVDVN